MIKLPIIWTSNDFADSPNEINLNLSKEEIERIEKLIEIAKENNIIIKMRLKKTSQFSEEDDFFPNLEYIIIHSDEDLHYEASTEYVTIESEFFDLKDII